ncbi:MAG: Asp-tRNA(Asn)/Glu-tRNA(Gln) amidotransferase subunit GatC [Clostridia bacterium]|nr:Asp-tRNA(Asn)/Glu-tRNA(Gln) amidotransferase subunit GatC [Clostridia bacterium]
MKITKHTVDYVANLARLNFNDEEALKLSAQMEDILAYMDKLNSLNTENVIPMEHVKPVSNIFRKDMVSPSFDREQILRNAPVKEDGAFKVPKIVE